VYKVYFRSPDNIFIVFFSSKQVSVAVTIVKYNLDVPCSNALLINDKAVSFI